MLMQDLIVRVFQISGCTNPFACDYNPAATVDTGCTYLTGDDVPTETDNVWLVVLQLSIFSKHLLVVVRLLEEESKP